MEHQSATNIIEIREKLARLETSQFHERHNLYRELASLYRALGALESQLQLLRAAQMAATSSSALDVQGWIKLILAFLLPVAVLMATGSAELAARAAKLSHGL